MWYSLNQLLLEFTIILYCFSFNYVLCDKINKSWKLCSFIVLSNVVDNQMESTLPIWPNWHEWLVHRKRDDTHRYFKSLGKWMQKSLMQFNKDKYEILHHGLMQQHSLETDWLGISSLEEILVENKLKISLNASMPWRRTTYWLHQQKYSQRKCLFPALYSLGWMWNTSLN